MKQTHTERILVVDDEIHALHGVSRIMAGAGYEVFEAGAGTDCLRLAAEHKPDLILLDVVLPDIDGREVCRRIKSDPETADIYVILLSGMHIQSDRQAEGLEQGADGYIARPIPNRELLAGVKSMLKLKNVEKRLRESEERFRIVADYAYDWEYWVNPEGDFSYVSPSCERITGYTALEFLDDPDLMNRIVHPDDSREMAEHYCHVKEIVPDAAHAMDFRIVQRDGETRWIGHVCQPVYDQNGQLLGRRGSNKDITERKRAEVSLQAEKDKLRGILHAMNDGVYIVNAQYDIEYVNPVIEAGFGCTAGRKCYEYFHDRSDPCPWCKNQEVFAGKSVQWEWYSYKTGKTYELFDSPVRNPDGSISKLEIFHDITERKRMEEALSESERFLRQSEKIARTGGWKANPFTNRLHWTEGVYDILEAPRDYLPNFEEGATFFVPEHRPIIREAIENTLNHGNPFKLEAEVLTSRGKRLWTEIRGLMRVDAGEEPQVVGSLLDITERKIAEADQNLLSTAIEQAAEGVVITDPNGIIQYVNPAEEKISGYSKDQLIGKGADIFKSDKHSEDFFTDMWATISAGNVWSGRFINRKNDGTEYHEDSTISPVYDKSGSLTNFVALKHDVTKHIDLQTQLFQAQKMEAIGTLAGGFAHDFNNKLQVIDGCVDLALFNQDLPETVRSDLEVIKQTVSSSAELIKGMMVFSRKAPVEFHPINLNELVSQAGSILSRSIPRMIEIDFFLADDLWTVNCDKTQIEQILMNLAVNARDAMPDGGKLTVKTDNIALDEEYCCLHPAAKPGRYVMITVSDTGAGMDKETVSHIFEPFFTTKEPGKGTGLGLAVVYGIVEQHGGKIICDSEPSVGTVFRIYFPTTEEVPREQYPEKKEPLKGQGETILVVDDEPNILKIVSRLLNRANYSVITASNGKNALEVYHKHRMEIRLVILDLIMPGMDGKQCLQALQSTDSNVRVLIATGQSGHGMAEDLKEVGAKDFIKKPFDMPQLLEKIRKIIDGD